MKLKDVINQQYLNYIIYIIKLRLMVIYYVFRPQCSASGQSALIAKKIAIRV